MTEDYESLKAVNYRLNGEIGLMQLEINALRNQRDNALEMIRRMKCCGNCNFFYMEHGIGNCEQKSKRYIHYSTVCKNWELAE